MSFKKVAMAGLTHAGDGGTEAERYAHLLKLPRLRLLAVWPAPDRLSSNTNNDFATVIVRP